MMEEKNGGKMEFSGKPILPVNESIEKIR